MGLKLDENWIVGGKWIWENLSSYTLLVLSLPMQLIRFPFCSNDVFITQDLHVTICLLNKPYGFEDPFLDSIVNKSLLTKDFVIAAIPESKVMA